MAELSEMQQPQEPPVGKVKRSRSGLWLGITVLLSILAIAGLGFYLFQQLRSQQQTVSGEVSKGDMKLIELTKQITGYQAQIAAIQSQLATVEADVSGKNNHFNKTLSDFSQLNAEKLEGTKKELGADIQQLQRQLGKTRGDWLVADAEYLLSVANQRLYLMGDVNTTREALEAADQRLLESGDAGVFKVRDQITKDIAGLRNVTEVDVVGMYSALKSLQDRVNSLTLLLPYAGKAVDTPAEKAPEPKKTTKEDQDLVDSAIAHLEGMVTIKHADHSIKEILTPQQAEFIQEQLRLKLEMVKVALVKQSETLYQLGLAEAKKYTEENYAKNPETAKFIAELDRFSNLKVRSQFPDISLSLKMLRDITKQRIEADKALQAKPVEPAKPTPAPATSTAPAPAAGAPAPAATTEPAKPAEAAKPEAGTAKPVEKPVDAVKAPPAADTAKPAAPAPEPNGTQKPGSAPATQPNPAP